MEDSSPSGLVQLAFVGANQADNRMELDSFLEDEIVGVEKHGVAPLKNGKPSTETNRIAGR